MQAKKHFDDFWENAILPSIEQTIEEMASEFCTAASVNVQNLSSYKVELENIYRRKREWLKQAYLPHESQPCLDFHKLAAIVCRSVIGCKPIHYDIAAVEEMIHQQNYGCESHDEQINWFVNNIYANYKIAFLSAVGIVYANLIHWAINKKNECADAKLASVYNSFIQRLLDNKQLCSYENPKAHENYVNSMIIALMKNDLLQRDFDYLTFAINLYQLEYFTKLTLFHQVLTNTEYTIDDIDFS